MIRKSSSDTPTLMPVVISRRDFIAVVAATTASGILLPRASEAQTVSMINYYIGPNGSDGNPGTQTQPWAITALQSKSAAIAGKTVGLLDGTYICNIGQTDTGSSTGGLQWNAPGCTIKAVNAQRAVITTNNSGVYPQAGEPCIQILASNCTIDGIKFYQSACVFLRVTGSGTTIKNCHFEDVKQSRYTAYASLYPADNVGAIITASNAFPTWTVDNCYFSNILNTAAGENSCCIGPLYYAGNTTITRCTFANSRNGIGWKSHNVGPLTVTQCYFDSSITAVAVHGGMSNDEFTIPMRFTFKNNVCNRVGYAVDSWQANSSFPDTESWSDIQHNTFIITSKADTFGVGAIAYSDSMTGRLLSGTELHQSALRDNVFQRFSGTAPILYWQAGRNSSVDMFGPIDYNLHSAINMRDANGMTYSNLADWRTRTGQESHTLNAAATFINSAGSTAADYKLASGGGKGAASDGTDMGAWGGGVTQIGCIFSATGGVQPMAPSLTGVG